MGYIYKYVNENNVIEYIGKTVRHLSDRINEHSASDLKDFCGKIYYAEIADDYNLDIVEKFLINKYSPVRNVVYTHCIFTIDENLLEWKLFNKEKELISIIAPEQPYFNLKELLSERGMSQNKLSRLTGIRSATICDMYNGRSKSISLKNIALICATLNCKVEELIKI